jgi:DNA (cytosine-5)-methyltransferase 1
MNEIIENKIPILSFFSGGGFLDMGFEMADFNIVWTNENDEMFSKLHAYGITSWRKSRGNGIKAEIFNTKSILKIKPTVITKEAFNGNTPCYFGIIGGPPCQDFSSAGNNAGFDGDKGHLTIVFFDYIHKINPTFFVFENVRNLWDYDKHRERFLQILNKLRKNYFIDHKILNAINFGVPQDRERLFVIGIKKLDKHQTESLKQEFSFSWPYNEHYANAITKYKWPSINKFKSKPSQPKNIPSQLFINNIILKKFEEKLVPNGKEYFLPYSEKFWLVAEGDTLNRSFKRLHRYRYSPTACYGNNEVHLHPFLPRRISVREALRIQSVEDTYILPPEVSLTTKFKMIGNGVPVKLSFEVANSLKSYLKYYLK